MSTQLAVGDKAVYPAQGVAEVVGIDTKKIMNTTHTLYVLRVLDSDKKIMIPVDKIENVGLRQIMNESQIDEVYDILRERNVDLNTQTWNRRYRAYMEKIQTGSPFEIAEVFRDLNLLKFQKQLSFGEKKMLDKAKRLLVQELAIARDAKEDLVADELDHLFAAA